MMSHWIILSGTSLFYNSLYQREGGKAFMKRLEAFKKAGVFLKIVKIKGGLGNQMFQYALYKKLKNIGGKTYGDLSYFNKNNCYKLERIFNIEINTNYNLVLKKIFENDNLFFKIFRKVLKSILVKNVIQQNDVEFKENILNYNYFDGYWQSEIFFSRY